MALALLAAAPAGAQGREPLLMDGKKTLFQRVLSRPGAIVRDAPDGKPVAALAPFTVLYVYGRGEAGGEPVLEVGRNARGNVAGFVAGSQLVQWDHSLAVAFANPAGRERVLFFRGEDEMLDLVESDDLRAHLDSVRAEVGKTGVSPDSKIVAQEPENWVSIEDQFYLLPVLSAQQAVLETGFRVKTLEVASVTLEPEDEAPAGTVPEPAASGRSKRVNPNLEGFSAAVVFVIDASGSMQPYIDRAREAVAQVYRQVSDAGLEDQVRFGLVGYRDDPQAVPGVEYLKRVFVDPGAVRDRAAFLERAASLSASPVSTRTYEEDGFAGVLAAVEEIDWKPYGGRYVVFITDFSSRGAGHEFSSTGLNAEQVNQRARAKQIAIYALHLKTPAGEKRGDHPKAQAQYTQLAKFAADSLYYAVPSGDADRFRETVGALADKIVAQVRDARAGKLASGRGRDEAQEAKQTERAKPTAEEALLAKADLVGQAMQLAWLGRKEGTKAPAFYRAWAVDSDLDDPARPALEVRVLLTKTQLGDLQASLAEIVEVGIANELSRSQFFDQLRSAAAAMSRDPTRVGKPDARSLAETGLLGEYLEGLPYKSKVLSLTETLWNSWSPGEQIAFLDDLEAKIALYQRFHDDVDHWVSLDEDAAPGDAVYPVMLDALP